MLLAAVALRAQGVARPPAESVSASQLAIVDSLFAEWRVPGSPGCSVGASRNGVQTLARAYGYANLEYDVPMSGNSIFQVASISKQFTATSVLLLAQQGKLALGDDIRKYVPELPDYGHVITLDHLLRHTSGLRDYDMGMQIAGWPSNSRVLSNADILDFAFRQRGVNRAPGQSFEYSNVGYTLLALTVERVSGMSLPEFARRNIFVPMGMTNTVWREDFRAIVKGRALGYRKFPSGYVTWMDMSNAYGAGGLLSTVSDLLRWNAALDAGRMGLYVTAELQREGVTGDGRPLGYARGLWINRYRGQREISHGGFFAGYQSTLLRYPDVGLSVVVLCNAYHANTPDLAKRVADLLLPPEPAGAQRADALPEVALPPDVAGRYVGAYQRIESGLIAQITLTANALAFNGLPLRPLDTDRFRLLDDTVVFRSADSMEIRGGGTVAPYRRANGALPNAGELEALQGRYTSAEGGTTVDACSDGTTLLLRTEDFVGTVWKLTPVGPDLFRLSNNAVQFHRDSRGAVTGYSWAASGVRELRYQRIPGDPPRCTSVARR